MIEPIITVSTPNDADVFNHDMLKINSGNSDRQKFDSSSSALGMLSFNSRKRKFDVSIDDDGHDDERKSFVAGDACNYEDFEKNNSYFSRQHFEDVGNPLIDAMSKSDLQTSRFNLHPYNEFSPMKRKKCQDEQKMIVQNSNN